MRAANQVFPAPLDPTIATLRIGDDDRIPATRSRVPASRPVMRLGTLTRMDCPRRSAPPPARSFDTVIGLCPFRFAPWSLMICRC